MDTVYVADGTVMKPGEETLQALLSEVVSTVQQDGFRLANVVKPTTGGWTYRGWGACSLLPGETREPLSTSDILTVLEAGRAFHASTKHLPRPSSYLDSRTDPWSRADAAAWGERPLDIVPAFQPLVAALKEAVTPLGPDQFIHGDLTGNVLLGADVPGIIDISPYFRPTAYAEGIVMADALAWHGQRSELLDRAGVSVSATARGILFRVCTSSVMAQEQKGLWDLEEEVRQYTHAAKEIGLMVDP